jgi:hypothetical protein
VTRARQFIEDYVASGNYATPEVELSFLADPVIDFFGEHGLTHSDILANRRRHIEAWPERRYSLQGTPQLLGKEGQDISIVLAVIQYELVNNQVSPEKRRSGISRSVYRIKSIGSKFKIVSAMEGKQE